MNITWSVSKTTEFHLPIRKIRTNSRALFLIAGDKISLDEQVTASKWCNVLTLHFYTNENLFS